MANIYGLFKNTSTTSGDSICNIQYVSLYIIRESKQKIDLTNVFRTLIINENIHSPVLTGTIEIQDPGYYLSEYPITTQDTLEITVKSKLNDLKLSLSFFIMDQAQDFDFGANSKVITLTIKDNNYKNFYTLFSSCWNKSKNKSYNSFLYSILTEKFKLNNVYECAEVDTGELNSVAFPYMSLLSQIGYMNNFIKDFNGNAPFYFYRSLYGFWFETIGTMIKRGEAAIFKQVKPQEQRLHNANFSIYDIKWPDVGEILSTNGFGGTQYYYSFTDKKIKSDTYKPSDIIPTLIGIGGKKSFWKMSDDFDKSCINIEANKKNTLSQLIQLNNIQQSQKLRFPVRGILERSIGMLVNIELINPNIVKDPVWASFKGPWIVESIEHIFSSAAYEQMITVTRTASISNEDNNIAYKGAI